jgi:hypothetical protein
MALLSRTTKGIGRELGGNQPRLARPEPAAADALSDLCFAELKDPVNGEAPES